MTLHPTGMLEAMMQAEVGDEFYGDDLAILELQDLSTELLGKSRGYSFLAEPWPTWSQCWHTPTRATC